MFNQTKKSISKNLVKELTFKKLKIPIESNLISLSTARALIPHKNNIF